jgi:membrane dipeptidase
MNATHHHPRALLIVDAHLDLAYNVTRGRDPRQPAARQPFVDNEFATVGLPDLRAGNVSLVCATIFCSPASYKSHGYRTADEARAQALAQLQTYQSWINEGELKFISRSTGFQPVLQTQQNGLKTHATNAILLLEGADALRTPADVQEWFEAGLRVVGLAWKRTRAAGGTGEPGGLTDEGRALVKEFDRLGIIHDASHLAEQAFWELLDATGKPIIASHSNCRVIVPTDRQLSDDMIKAIARRGGVIGINFYDKFLLPPGDAGKRRATLDDVIRHMRHICDVTGSTDHVAIGTDMDGGLGREQIPQEIHTSADLIKLAPALRASGFNDNDVEKILGANWLRFFQANLA